MSDDVERNGNGQFRPGRSGNAAWARLRRPKALMTPADLDRIVMEVAGSETIVNVNGDRQKVSLYQANVVGLGSMNPGNRLASKDFIEVTHRSAHRLANVHKE